MPTLSTELLAPAIAALTSAFTNPIPRSPGSAGNKVAIQRYKTMLRRDPVTSLCVEVICLYILMVMGEYSHPVPRIQKQVRAAIENCKGSWASTIRGAATYLWFGESFSEFAFSPGAKYGLKEIRQLDPERCTSEGTMAGITQIKFKGATEVIIPYEWVLHLVNKSELTFSPAEGIALCESAEPFWEAHKVLMPILSIAAQRQATPILVQKTRTGDDVIVLEANGQPKIDQATGRPVTIKKAYQVVKTLEKMGNAGVTAIDIEDDLFSIEQRVAGDFLLALVRLCEQYRMMSFLVPATLAGYSISGVGDSGLADSHRQIFEMIAASWAGEIGDAIVEKVLRPMIEWNWGAQESYGKFPINRTNPQALELAGIVETAIKDSTPLSQHLPAINKLCELLGIEPIKELPQPQPQPQPQPLAQTAGQ